MPADNVRTSAIWRGHTAVAPDCSGAEREHQAASPVCAGLYEQTTRRGGEEGDRPVSDVLLRGADVCCLPAHILSIRQQDEARKRNFIAQLNRSQVKSSLIL